MSCLSVIFSIGIFNFFFFSLSFCHHFRGKGVERQGERGGGEGEGGRERAKLIKQRLTQPRFYGLIFVLQMLPQNRLTLGFYRKL